MGRDGICTQIVGLLLVGATSAGSMTLLIVALTVSVLSSYFLLLRGRS